MSGAEEPPVGSWVYAAIYDCPSRFMFQRRKDGWYDCHGCCRNWDELVEPIDTLAPEEV